MRSAPVSLQSVCQRDCSHHSVKPVKFVPQQGGYGQAAGGQQGAYPLQPQGGYIAPQGQQQPPQQQRQQASGYGQQGYGRGAAATPPSAGGPPGLGSDQSSKLQSIIAQVGLPHKRLRCTVNTALCAGLGGECSAGGRSLAGEASSGSDLA